MKVLYVFGDDFAALEFEENVTEDNLVLWNKSMELKNKGEDPDVEFSQYCFYTALEFKDVDPKFMEFIGDKMIDEDFAKTNNYYIVEE